MSTTRNLGRIPGHDDGPALAPAKCFPGNSSTDERSGTVLSKASPTGTSLPAPQPTLDDIVTWIRQEFIGGNGFHPSSEDVATSSDGMNPSSSGSYQNGSLTETEPTDRNGSLGPSMKGSCRSRKEAQWYRMGTNLELAQQNAQFGEIVPELKRFRGVTRKLARLAARGILYIGRVFTQSQRKFNVATLSSLRDLYFMLRKWEQALLETREQERHAVADLIARVHKLEKDYGDLKDQTLAFGRQTAPLKQDGERQPREPAPLAEGSRENVPARFGPGGAI
jgi:hypothetical protein